MKPSTKTNVLKDSADNLHDQSIIDTARKVLNIESQAIAELGNRIDDQFVNVVHHLNQCKHLVVTGVGKSGLIGKKISSTFSSIGLPSLFLHASEASHGDLGMISEGDTVIAISNSGETEEIVKLLPVFNRIQCTLVGMTGNMESSLAKKSDYVLDVSVKEEACSKDLVPTASTTATLAMGDALAMVFMELRGVQEEDFALNHPGGSLGRKLLTLVDDLMHSGEDIPLIKEEANIYQVHPIAPVCKLSDMFGAPWPQPWDENDWRGALTSAQSWTGGFATRRAGATQRGEGVRCRGSAPLSRRARRASRRVAARRSPCRR